MKVYFRIILVSFIFTLSMYNSYAQITINNTLYTPTQLVNSVLVPSGSGTTVSNIILKLDDLINKECINNINYLECVVNFYVQFITYGLIVPYIYLLFVYNLLLNKPLPMIFYVFCLFFLSYF